MVQGRQDAGRRRARVGSHPPERQPVVPAISAGRGRRDEWRGTRGPEAEVGPNAARARRGRAARGSPGAGVPHRPVDPAARGARDPTADRGPVPSGARVETASGYGVDTAAAGEAGAGTQRDAGPAVGLGALARG